jgi:hypothetical protein
MGADWRDWQIRYLVHFSDGGSGGALAGVDDARRVCPRDAARRSARSAPTRPAGGVRRRPRVVSVWSRFPKAVVSPHRCAGEGLHGIIIA